jgi:hypothetical protein
MDGAALVVPRLVFSQMRNDHYISIIQNQTVSLELVDLILASIQSYKFDGIVLEMGIFRYANLEEFLSNTCKTLLKYSGQK